MNVRIVHLYAVHIWEVLSTAEHDPEYFDLGVLQERTAPLEIPGEVTALMYIHYVHCVVALGAVQYANSV